MQVNGNAIDYQTYAKNMRLALSNKEMILEDGSINHQYFLVKKGAYWDKTHDEKLIEGIAKHGIGNWEKIKTDNQIFKEQDFELELRACALLSINSIQDYDKQKLTKTEIQKERKSNIKLATKNKKIANDIYLKY